MHGKFDSTIPLPAAGNLTIKGPFDPGGDDITRARVLFIIVQGKGTEAVTVEGMGVWTAGHDEWIATNVSRTGELPKGTGTKDLALGSARGIALAISVQAGKLVPDLEAETEATEEQTAPPVRFDPPAIGAVTWCAHFMFT
jgi:hypothetical protein